MTITEYLSSIDEDWKFILTDDDVINVELFAHNYD